MKANISDMVVVYGANINGTMEHPAVITRVFSDHDTKEGPVMVNATMFPDGGGDHQFQRSIWLFESREEAEKRAPGKRVAFWP